MYSYFPMFFNTEFVIRKEPPPYAYPYSQLCTSQGPPFSWLMYSSWHSSAHRDPRGQVPQAVMAPRENTWLHPMFGISDDIYHQGKGREIKHAHRLIYWHCTANIDCVCVPHLKWMQLLLCHFRPSRKRRNINKFIEHTYWASARTWVWHHRNVSVSI